MDAASTSRSSDTYRPIGNSTVYVDIYVAHLRGIYGDYLCALYVASTWMRCTVKKSCFGCLLLLFLKTGGRPPVSSIATLSYFIQAFKLSSFKSPQPDLGNSRPFQARRPRNECALSRFAPIPYSPTPPPQLIFHQLGRRSVFMSVI